MKPSLASLTPQATTLVHLPVLEHEVTVRTHGPERLILLLSRARAKPRPISTARLSTRFFNSRLVSDFNVVLGLLLRVRKQGPGLEEEIKGLSGEWVPVPPGVHEGYELRELSPDELAIL
ncbi:hypothetical protein PanWU01x14_309890 [Parasponia andersonii]|uniref:Uncharacterized protein n=1 Tax=Parasponia andersonii TaxID=3476 RepID=A0A2P5AQH0_PARAD|nr:hypothetical protein PanWU01x14_309890 [Parasponia andersonii]